jgi:hypothetical protein
MSDEINKQLAELATKLGVSAEHLWSVLVRQAYIDGISSLVTVIVCGILSVAALWFFFLIRPRIKAHIESNDRGFSITMVPVEYLVLITTLAILVSVACNNFYRVISDFTNPEFYAWRELSRLR